jgi:uncharacterized membrane protein YgcG
MTRFAAALSLLIALACGPAGAAEVPYLTGRVVDDAEILKPATRSALADKLKAHESRTTNQVVVLTERTLGNESIEEFATAAFADWKLGQRGKDNGVLVIVVPNDRRMRIEVGYGLEGTLTDVQAQRIIRNVMAPAFKAATSTAVSRPVSMRSSTCWRAAPARPKRRRPRPHRRRSFSTAWTCPPGRCASCSARSSSASSASSRSWAS